MLFNELELNNALLVENENLVNFDPKDKILLLDADTLAFATCSSCEIGDDEAGYSINIDYAIDTAIERIEEIKQATKISTIELHFTGGKNFRYKLFPKYKANRKNRAPKGLIELKAKLLNYYDGEIHTLFEADDVVVSRKTYAPNKYIIASPDKDVYFGCPGTNFNYYRRPKYNDNVTDIKMSWIKVTEYEALVWSYLQVLMGDKSDNIQGIFNCGTVTAIDLLLGDELNLLLKQIKLDYKSVNKKSIPSDKLWKLIVQNKILNTINIPERILWDRVVTAYNNNNLTVDDALLNMRLVCMNQINENGELKLWNSPK